ncbi:serine/threonine protein phosphatase 1 [Sphingomonas laterariae]|uniref:Serine/threonine protein phosphatase 1 n=1 Tax=Edaphosphingomonas laterariae TaxID=861865 RepID=A0A239HB84_9SPHN|nr:metallophosphoesterase family protein [Sphingomonas laterariae]SNS78053.1 serine/threonine protein phosphatase 1 [Sphingomonas laterariae]
MRSLANSLMPWPRRRRTPTIPDGQRVCAIGDIHGCLDILGHLFERIDADLEARDAGATQIVILGDFIDRGPDSAAVVDLLRAFDSDPHVTVLMGNHEAMAVDALRGRAGAMAQWLAMGGDAALASWGVPHRLLDQGDVGAIAEAAAAQVPGDVIDWLEALPHYVAIGDYLFVHAGVRPGVALEDQEPGDLLWIRDEFLDSRADHGRMVIHGHSAEEDVSERRNRIGIDTGAYWTGRLTALCLQGTERWLVSTG